MEQSLLLTLHERFARAESKDIETTFNAYMLQSRLPIEDALCELAGMILDDIIPLAETNPKNDEKWIGFTINVRDFDVIMDCSCTMDERIASPDTFLRLAEAQEIAARPGGHVKWHKWDKDGVAVVARLPYREGKVKKEAWEAEPAYKILMIDDNADARRLNSRALMMEGYKTLEADSLADGRRLLEKAKPDLLLLGPRYSGHSGYDFCRELRRENSIPILFATDYVSKTDTLAGYGAGCDAFIGKEYYTDVVTLSDTIEGLLKRSGKVRGGSG